MLRLSWTRTIVRARGKWISANSFKCKNWYPIFRTVSDHNAPFRQPDFRSVRSFAVKPAPMARREAALGLTARRGRADQLTALTAHLTIIICAEGTQSPV